MHINCIDNSCFFFWSFFHSAKRSMNESPKVSVGKFGKNKSLINQGLITWYIFRLRVGMVTSVCMVNIWVKKVQGGWVICSYPQSYWKSVSVSASISSFSFIINAISNSSCSSGDNFKASIQMLILPRLYVSQFYSWIYIYFFLILKYLSEKIL